MRAVIYARYSSDKQSAASIDDQLRNCLAYAKREGWQVGATYADRAISATKSNRPEYLRMLADAERKAFDILLVDDLSRLDRVNHRQGKTIEDLKFWGIRIVGVSDAVDTKSKSHKVVQGVRGIINDVFLDDLRDKTHRGLKGKALKGQNTGGRAYGYRHIPIESKTQLDEYGRPKIEGATKEIAPDQAKVVRQIFQLYADGLGYNAIAGRLNTQAVASPRNKKWKGTAIRPMLTNQLYVGRVVWNRREWIRSPEGGRIPRARPQEEWVITNAPELRIVDDALWERVQARRAAEKNAHVARQKEGKARAGKVPIHLFSGIVFCGECGGRYIKADGSHYRCSTYKGTNGTECTNKIGVRMDAMEPALLHAIKTEIFTEDSFAEFKAEAERVIDQRMKARKKDGAELGRQLAKVESEIANLLGFIKSGVNTPTLATELHQLEADKARLLSDLNSDLPRVEDVKSLLDDALDRYWSMVVDLDRHVARDVAKARNMIRALVGEKIIFRPTGNGGLNAEMQGSVAGLVTLIKGNPGAKAGAAFLTQARSGCGGWI